ncbi:hypothetical protein BESB_044380 [Besnoitia besnoiti]|uniref:Uncharacterized protein n=1 Tax=Besnoitia besnoiti TaxID=94643 RepID=A0A2A9MJV5_BESBE|nr:hypothetical protein BESB_044380 [Besnoitia besnoiti]PFH36246.1 hypothetical protein BESB_044380 [Besnoitia besnoiti]
MDRVTKEGTPRPPTTAAPSSKMRLQKQLMPLKDSRPTATNCETHSGQLLLPSSASSFSPSSCCASLPSASSPSLSASSSPLWVGPKEGSSSTPPSVPVGSSFNASLPASSRSPSSLFRDTDERRQRRNEFPTNRKEIEAARNMQARRIDPYSCEVNRIEREAWRASSAAAEAASVVLTAARCLRRASTRQRGERLDCEVSPAEGVSAAKPPQNATSRISVEANLFASPGGVAPPEAFSVPLKKKSSVTDSDDGASPAEFPSSPPFEPESSRPPTSSSSPLSSPLSSSSPYYLKAPVYIRPSPPEASSLDPSPSAMPSDFPRAGCSVASSLSPSSESHAALTASASWASPPQSPGLASSALKTASVSASQATNSTHILRRGGAALTSPHAPPDLPLQSRGPRGNQMCEDDASNASPPCRHRIAFASSASASSAESDLPAPARTHANRCSCTVKLSAAPSMFSATASTCASLSVSSASLSHAPRKPNERASRGPNSRALPVGHTKERRNSKRGGSRNHVETKRCEEASEPSHERRRALEGENEERKSAACNPSSAGMSQGCPSTTAAKRKEIESFYLEANLAEEPANYDCRARGEPRRPTSSQDCQPLSLQRRALPATQNRERVETPAGADRKARRMADAAQATGGNVKPRRTSRERTAEELYGFMYVIYVERLKTKMNHAAEEGKAKSRNHSHGDTEKASPDARRSSRFSERRDRKASCRRESEKGRMQTLQLVATTKSLGLEVAVASCALETVPGRLSSRVPADEPRAKPASVETRFASFLVVPGRGSEPADVGGNLKRASARPLRPADVTLCLEILDAQRIPLIRGVLRLPGSGASEHFFKHRVLLTPAFASPRHGTPHDDAGQTVASVLVAAQKRWTQLRGSSGRFQLANQPLHFALEQRDPQARYLTQALPFLSSLPPAVSRASKKGLDAPTEYALAAANSSAMESTTPHKASATAASALNVKVSRDRHTTVDCRSLLLPSPAQDGVAEQHVKATPPTPADAPSPLFPRMPSGNSMPPPLSLGSSESASAFAFSDSLAQTRAREALTKDRHVANDLRLDCNDSNTSAALSAGSGRSPHASLRVRRPRRGEAETLGMAESAASPSCLMPNSTSLPCDEAGESFQWSLSEDGSEGAVCGTDAREGGAGDWAKGDDEGGKNGVAMPRKAEEICESEKGGRQLKPESSWAEQQPDRCARNRQGQVGTATSKKSEKPLERQALRERITDRQAQIKSLKTRLDRLKGLSSPAQDFREDGGTALQRGRRSETEVERSGEKRPETDVDLDAAAATLQSVNPDEAQTPKGEAVTLTAEPRVTATAEANSSAGGGRAPKVGGGFVGAAASSSPSPLASSACASLSPPSALAIVASDSSAAYQISSVSSALPTDGASPATRGASPSFSPLPAAKVHLQREPEEAPRSCMLREEGEIAQSGEQTGRRECSAAGPRAAWVASAVLRDEAGAMKQTHATLPQARPDATPAQSPEGLRKARMPSDQTKRNAGELCDETSDGPQDSLSSQKTDRGNLSPRISLAASSARLLHADMTPAFAAHSARDGRDALDPSFKVSPLGSASLEPASSALSPLSAACSLVSQPPTSRASPSDSRPPALSSSPAAPASTSLRHAPSPAETLLPRTATSAADLFGARAASLGEQPMSRGKQQRVIVAGNVIEIFCSQGTAKSQRHPRGAPSSELAASCDSATARDTAASQEKLSRERGAEVQGGERPCQGGTNRPDGVQAQIGAPESGDVSYASGESERIQESDWQRRHRVELQEAGAFAHGGGAVEEIVLGRVNAARSNEESCADPASRHQLAQPSEPGAELPQSHEEADKMHAAHETNSESIALRVTAVSHLACVSRATARTCGALRGALSLDNAQECDEALSSPRAGRAGIQAAETKRVKDEDRRDRRQEGRREEGREEEGQEEEGREEAGGEEEGDEASIGRDSHARNQRSSHGVEAHDFSREAAVREGTSKAGDEASTSLAAQSKGQPAFHQVASADDYAAQTLEVRDGARPVHGDSRVPEEPRLSQIPSQPRERGNESGRRGGAARAAAFFESRLSQCLASRAFAEARRNLRVSVPSLSLYAETGAAHKSFCLPASHTREMLLARQWFDSPHNVYGSS